MIAAADQEDAIGGVDRHACDIAVLVSGGKLLPAAAYQLIGRMARLCWGTLGAGA